MALRKRRVTEAFEESQKSYRSVLNRSDKHWKNKRQQLIADQWLVDKLRLYHHL
jgi:hypothetical protein